ncbi:MAG: archease [Phycisphaerae bacterium]|nr:archease [Phycisphaerae bacterium]
MKTGFELFEHTADLGVRVWAPTPIELLRPACAGLYACAGEFEAQGPEHPLALGFDGDDPAYLLHDYLSELLQTLVLDRRIAVTIEALRFDDTGLRARAITREISPTASAWQHEVKAVTYHQLAVRPAGNGFEAIFIVDI